MSGPASPSRRRLLRAGAVAAGATIAGGAMVASGNRLHVHRVPPAPGDASAPSRRAPLRIAVLTDVHAPHYWFSFESVATAARAFDPHLVLVVGDALNRRGDERLVRAYGEIPARLARFAALGNWEYQGNCDLTSLRAEYERAGVRLLVNEAATVDHDGEPLRVVGLDDLLRGRPALRLLEELPGGASAPRSLLLAHCPALFDSAVAATRAPFTAFAGHTHGGQIAPFGRALLTPPGSGAYVKGWYGDVAQRAFVSRGLGNSDIPFRVGSPPELALITL